MTPSDRRRLRQPNQRSEDGDTLIELLMAVAILGLVAVATLFGFSSAISTSATYRGLATLDTVLRSAASQATTQVQQNDVSGAVSLCNFAPIFRLPSGFTPQLTRVGLIGSGGVQVCSISLPTLPQLLRASVTYNGTTQSINFVVDDPAAPPPIIGTTATQLVFVGQIGNATAGSNLANPQVEVEDANGNPVTNDLSAVVLSVNASGVPLCTGIPSYGVVTFSNCSIAAAGQYKLTAGEAINNPLQPVVSATSNSFTILAGPPAQLAFTNTPSSATIGVPFTSQPVVTVEDAIGNPITSSAAVTLTVASGSGSLNNCLANPVTTLAGVAGFTGCQIASGTPGPFTLKASAAGLSSATSSSIAVVGPAAKLVFTASPSAATFGSAFTTQPVVTVEDASGNPVPTRTAAVALGVGSGTGTGSCTASPVTAVAGVATFSGCQLSAGTAGSFRLTATSGALTSATSNSFTVAAGPATQLVFTTPPSNGSFGSPFATQPVVTVDDANNNPVTTSTASVTLAINTGTGTGTCSATAVAGVATFAGCKLTGGTAGAFTLRATSAGLTSVPSSSFTVGAGPASTLVFTTTPGNGRHGSAFATQPVVTVVDSSGNTVIADTSSVKLAMGPNSGTASLSCAADPVAAVAGVAFFSGCQISSAGSYTLVATDGSLAGASTTLTMG